MQLISHTVMNSRKKALGFSVLNRNNQNVGCFINQSVLLRRILVRAFWEAKEENVGRTQPDHWECSCSSENLFPVFPNQLHQASFDEA